MNIAIYIRVSTIEQVEGFSIDVQKDRLASYCKSQGWDDPKLYMDDGYTGTNMNRPALKRLIRHIEEGKINGVIVYKLDRLGRKQKDVMYLLEDVFEKRGVIFKSATEPFDTSTPFGKAMIGVLSVFAQLERDMIIERTTSGRREKVNQGFWPGGRVAYGYRWDKDVKQLFIVPNEAAIIRDVFRKYLSGESRLAIAEWASERTKSRKFDHSIIRDILSRRLYNGWLINNGTFVRGNHEAIIDDDLWGMVQNEIAKRKDGVSPMGDYLLTGLLTCGVCSGNVVHVKRSTKVNERSYVYELYACKNQHVRAKDRKVDTCSLGYHQRTQVEDYVVSEMMDIALKPRKIIDIIEAQKTTEPDIELEKSLRTQLETVTTGIENLYDAIQSGIKASAISGRLARLEEERNALQLQLDDLEDARPLQKSDEDVHLLITQISQAWPYLTEDEQKQMIRKIIRNIVLMPDKKHKIVWNTEA